MTPEGISTGDWDRVHQAAVDIVNATAIEDEILCDHHTERLFEILDELESKYGRATSILATRANFTDDSKLAIALHEEAQAVSSNPISTRLSLQSLIRLLIDGRMNEKLISARLAELERMTKLSPEPSDHDELQELKCDFERMKTKRCSATDL